MGRKDYFWMVTLLLGLALSGILACGKSKKGTLEVSPELKGVLEITHKFAVEYGSPTVQGGIRNIGNKKVSLSVEVEFYDTKKRLLKSESPQLSSGWGHVTLKPEEYSRLFACPSLDPDEIASYKIIITPSQTRW